MKNQTALKLIATCAIGTRAEVLFAHENHGMSGTHWHATDAWGFVALGVLAVLAFWLHHNRK